ncbi:MAG: hypothetical protein J2P17_22040 [Mycobacterium sp.]|nr:hypothetical protein [Mycobacterium sp.]
MKTANLLAAMGTVIGVALATATPATADVTVPIGPDQVFHGLVNGVHDKAQITVVCPGPVMPGQTGHPAAGQTISVAQGPTSSSNGGYTGSAGTSVVAGFSTWSSATVWTFTTYNDPQPIPTTISVPCSGSDTISFVPQPTSSTAKADQFTVTFVNIAV